MIEVFLDTLTEGCNCHSAKSACTENLNNYATLKSVLICIGSCKNKFFHQSTIENLFENINANQDNIFRILH